MGTENVYKFRDVRGVPDIVHEYSASLRDASTSLIIDNGSYQCRAGWATDDDPRLVFRSVTAKQRGKKESDLQIGNEISNIEVVRWLLKTQFDKNVVTQFDTQEQVFDYIFSHLGIDTEGGINHPIVLTEAVCNPNYNRQLMGELLFECYRVPSLTYGVDALFSLHQNQQMSEHTNGLVIDCGYHTTHVLPVLNGRLNAQHCKRINIGGSDLNHFMLRLMQLKYPGHLASLTLSRAEELVHEHSYTADEFSAQLNEWASQDYYDNHVHRMQLPFTPLPAYGLTAEAIREKRQQQVKRLHEIHARRKEEKLAEDSEKLQQLQSLQELLAEGSTDQIKALEDAGLSSESELQWTIDRVKRSIDKTLKKIQAAKSEEQDVDVEATDSKRSRSQSPAESKRKKAGDTEDVLDVSELTELRVKRQELLDTRAKRKKVKEEMAKRRTYASQKRMKILTQLASGKSEKSQGGKKEDTFGMDESDWNVYKEISKDGGESESEEEREKLGEVEALLMHHDPEFQKEMAELAQPSNVLTDIEEYYKLYVGVERVRVPELLFQPWMIGSEQAGLAETVELVLAQYAPDDQDRLAQNVFLTGGPAMHRGFLERMERELQMMRPFQSKFRVVRAGDAVLDAWKGARLCSQQPGYLAAHAVTREEYDERGGEYMKEHHASNLYRSSINPAS